MAEYKFNSKVYVQNKLVWGQVRQLAAVLKDIEFKGELTVNDVVDLLGDKLTLAFAVVLTEKGKSIKNKDIDKFSQELEEVMPVDVVVQVIEDFFTCNPVPSLIEKASGMFQKMNENLTTSSKE